MLADRYSQRARAYDEVWSPVIRPVGEALISHLPLSGARTIVDVGTGAGALLPVIRRTAPSAMVLGVDRAAGMLRLAREKHAGPLALMDAQHLALPANRFDVALVAFVLFHLPDPHQCLQDVYRVLKRGGAVGTATWGAERFAPANTIWDEELEAIGARVVELPATDNRTCCDSPEKMTALFEQAGFASIKVWSESIDHQWRAEDHFDYQVRATSRLRLESLGARSRETCFRRVRKRLSEADDEQYVYRGEVVVATAIKTGA